MVPQLPHDPVVRHHCATTPKRSQILLDNEVDGGRLAQVADPEPLRPSETACALSSTTLLVCCSLNDLDIRALSLQVHRRNFVGGVIAASIFLGSTQLAIGRNLQTLL